MAELFAGIVTARTWDQITSTGPGSANRLHVQDVAGQKKLVMTNAKSYLHEISACGLLRVCVCQGGVCVHVRVMCDEPHDLVLRA